MNANFQIITGLNTKRHIFSMKLPGNSIDNYLKSFQK